MEDNIKRGLTPIHQREIFACTFLRGSLSLLDHLHSLGCVHCDLKPDNFMVSSKGMLHMMDLGMAAPTGKEACLAGGTVAYTPPLHLIDPDAFVSASQDW
jgi:serine/threonine protein kinase